VPFVAIDSSLLLYQLLVILISLTCHSEPQRRISLPDAWDPSLRSEWQWWLIRLTSPDEMNVHELKSMNPLRPSINTISILSNADKSGPVCEKKCFKYSSDQNKAVGVDQTLICNGFRNAYETIVW